MQAINITFKDKTYSIPAYKTFQVADEVESIATLVEMSSWQANPRFVKIAQCYGAMLRFAGAKVTDPEVHTEMMAQIKAAKTASLNAADLFHAQAVGALMALLMDGMPEDMKGDADDSPAMAKKKKTAGL